MASRFMAYSAEYNGLHECHMAGCPNGGVLPVHKYCVDCYRKLITSYEYTHGLQRTAEGERAHNRRLREEKVRADLIDAKLRRYRKQLMDRQVVGSFHQHCLDLSGK